LHNKNCFNVVKFNERRLGVSKLVYIENDLSTSAEVIGAYLKHEKSLSVMSSGDPRFYFEKPYKIIFYCRPRIYFHQIHLLIVLIYRPMTVFLSA